MNLCIRPETEETDDRSPFKQGYDACFSAAYAPPNPFQPDTYDFNEWNFGWQEAERRCTRLVEEEAESGFSLAD